MFIKRLEKFFGVKKIDPKQLLKNILFIAVGCFITSAGINAFLVPYKFVSGGVSGLSQLLSYVTPVSIGTYVLLINIPIFIFGWRYVGRLFIVGSLFGMVGLALGLYATEWMASMGWAPEMLLSAIIGGAMSGGGTGLVFRVNSSMGGTDIVAAAVRKHWSVSIGFVSFIFNVMIICALGVKFGLKPALYTIISQLCASVALDKVMLGLGRSRAVFIISSKPQEIADLIVAKLHRGVTFLDGEGAYLHKKRRIIYCVVALGQLARVKNYVRSVDKDAFVTVAEVSEVLGKGFKTVPL